MKNVKRAGLLAIFSMLTLVIQLKAQDIAGIRGKCGTDSMAVAFYKQYPQYNAQILAAQKQLDDFTHQYQTAGNSARQASPYIIPVVVHIIHLNGTENISDAQVLDAIQVINDDYRKRNPDTVDIEPEFKNIAADCEIEFRLAKKDPSGNCTNGITRHVSALSSIGDHQVKSIVHWPPDKYLNIYVCIGAAGLAGHCLWPSQAAAYPQWDGIVISHSYFGSIGTSNLFRSTVLTHEIGHYFNLQHTWGGNNVPNFPYLKVAQPENCNYDDDVQDTPNTIGWQTCNLSGASCGSAKDNLQNYMEYAYCANMFTLGQKTRMHAALNSPVANRNNLWSPANLQATGVYDTPVLCNADFTADKKVVCINQPVKLSDVSYSGIESRKWIIQGANSFTTTDSTVLVSFPTPGTYSVTLKVYKGTDSLAINKNNIIRVLPAVSENAPYSESFENGLSTSIWADNSLDISAGFTSTNTASYSGTMCLKLDNFNNPGKSVNELVSENINITGVTGVKISFRYAFAYKDSIELDRVKIYASKDCGNVWQQRGQISGIDLPTVASKISTAFTPATNTEWKYFTTSALPASLISNATRFKISFEKESGNNFYIDDININNTVGIDENKDALQQVNLYPNPANDYTTLSFTTQSQQTVYVSLTDLSGKTLNHQLVQSVPNQNNRIQIPTHNLSAGIYILRIQSNAGTAFTKITKH